MGFIQTPSRAVETGRVAGLAHKHMRTLKRDLAMAR